MNITGVVPWPTIRPCLRQLFRIGPDRCRSSLIIPDHPRSARISPDQPGSARISPDRSLISPDQPGSARISPDQTRSARISPDQPGSARISSDQPGLAQISPDQPGSVYRQPPDAHPSVRPVAACMRWPSWSEDEASPGARQLRARGGRGPRRLAAAAWRQG